MITKERIQELLDTIGSWHNASADSDLLLELATVIEQQQVECENYKRALEEIRESSYREGEPPMDAISIHMLASKALGVPSKIQWKTAADASCNAGWKD